MRKWIDYYEILQVHPKAEKDVIKAAYRKLTALNHPDVSKEPFSEEKMKKINLAYEVLMDERRRRIFHEDWLENIKPGGDINSKRESRRKPTKEDMDALDCMKRYFKYLEDKDFKSAYKYITPYEKEFIRERDFVEWQEAVVKVIEISNVEIREFKKHRNYESRPGKQHFNAYEFEITLLEKNNVTSKISPNSFTKIVLRENNKHCVLVGYDNLRPVINKFNAMAEIKGKKDIVSRFQELEAKHDLPTGLLNKKGFIEEAQKEEIRFKRYGRIFSIMFIDLNCSDKDANKEELYEFVLGVIKKNTRKLDILARWGDKAYVLLLPETEMSNAEKVAEKFRKLFLDKEICVGQQVMKLRLETGVSEYNGHSLMETVYKAQVEKKSSRGHAESTRNVV